MTEDARLYDFDFRVTGIPAGRPDYARLFDVLDQAGVHRAADLGSAAYARAKKGFAYNDPVRSIVGDTIRQTTKWLNRTQAGSTNSELRVFSDGPDAELLLLSSLLADDATILSDSEVHLWSTELPNPVHAAYWEGLLDQMFICREALVEGRLVVCPAVVHRTVGRNGEVDGSYSLNFGSSLRFPELAFMRAAGSSSNTALGCAPETVMKTADGSMAEAPLAVPLLRIDLPIIRGADPAMVSRILREEPDGLRRLRFVTKELHESSGHELLTQVNLKSIAERIEHEVTHLQLHYRKLLREREQLLGSAALSLVGLVLSVSLPPALAQLAGALGAAATGLNSLKYVYALRETKHELHRNDYYLAWQAWRSRK